MTDDEVRFQREVRNADPEDLENIIKPAIQIERAYYKEQKPEEFVEYLREKQLVFKLRKALEGIWGHDLPDLKLEE
jgi:hypothetical protein